MAFPVIETADTKNGTVTSNSASWTLTYPTNLASGDLILMIAASDGNTTTIIPDDAGWTQGIANSAGSAISLTTYYKPSNGTETGTFTATVQGGTEQGGWRIFRITGWWGTALNGITSFAANGSSANPDPPNLDPAGWATEDTLWFACCAVDTSRTISVYPLASNNTADVSGGSTGATLGVCSTNSTVGSLDPGTFTVSASDDWCAGTIAVRPAAAAPPATLVLQHGFVNFNDPGVL